MASNKDLNGETGVEVNSTKTSPQDNSDELCNNLDNLETDKNPGNAEGDETNLEAEQQEDGQNEKRVRKLTERAKLNLEDEIRKRSDKVISSYEKWRQCAYTVRKSLLTQQSLAELIQLNSSLKKHQNKVLESYQGLSSVVPAHRDIVAKVDNCGALSAELSEVLTQRRLQETLAPPTHMDREQTRGMKYAHPSIFGESETYVTEHRAPSITSQPVSQLRSVTSLMAQAEAEKIEKLEAVKALEEQQLQRSKLMHLQVNLQEEQMRLETMQAKAAARVAEAKVNTLSAELSETESLVLRAQTDVNILNPLANNFEPMAERKICHQQESDIAQLAKVFSDSMAANRLPVPAPEVFSGNPLEFLEFQRSFQTLIENRGISATEKLYYLKQYVTGPARDAIDGFFYGTTETAYQGAWEKLRERFGQSFKLKQAFREKLERWPKINSKDSAALQKFADFLRGCQDAMPYIEGLSILDDCYENQKLLSKLPEWLVSRWNRTATETLDKRGSYPSFKEFVTFMLKEARVASNPISSLTAIKSQDQLDKSRQNPRQAKRPVGTALVTKVSEEKKQMSGQKRETSGQAKPCSLCSKTTHQMEKCPGFIAKTLQERKICIKEKGVCFGCLRRGHRFKECKRRHKCETCGRQHPTLLHEDAPEERKPNLGDETSPQEAEREATSRAMHLDGFNSTSMIVPVWVSSEQSPSSQVLIYALLDTQSDSSFILNEVAQSLAVTSHPVKLKLSTMVSSSTVECRAVSNLLVRGMSLPTQLKIRRCYTQDFIPADRSHIPTKDTATRWAHLKDIVKDMPTLQGCEVGMLIGYDCPQALAPKKSIMGRENEPYAVQTDLGWSIVGYAEPRLDQHSGHCHRVATREAPCPTPREIIDVLESDFAEKNHEDRASSQEDVQFVRCLKDNIIHKECGQLEMPLPFKSRPELPCNKTLALIRLRHLGRKMERDQRYKDHYQAFMKELLDSGYAEKVFDDSPVGGVNYIPHHGVYHPKKPDKIRVVFDCSAKFAGTSLNEHLLKGPDLTNSLIGVLCRFRQHRVAVMCDIEKMFYQFLVRKEDRDYLRFLWWENGDTKGHPMEFRMKVHLFGAASSPGCANYGLKCLASRHKEELPLASNFVSRNFYVDDGLASVRSTEECIQLTEEARKLCRNGGLRLHKFVSNDQDVMARIPESERASEVTSLSVDFSDVPMERALGIMWSVAPDVFCFRASTEEKPMTRRGILSTVASLYDPLGFVAPLILNGKRVLQEMCRNGMKWDDPIGDDLKLRWEEWCNELPQLEELKIPRCYYPSTFGEIALAELHHFSDASTLGYGQCSYLRLIGTNGMVHCTLVFAKARVAPTKVVTIPRLELTAAVVSVKVSTMLKSELEYDIGRECFWTDSRVVLGYINNEARKFHTFVANRVQLIRDRTKADQWRYVPTADNPADHASRGLSAAQLCSSNWYEGPSFLWNRELEYRDVLPELTLGDPEIKAHTLLTSHTASDRNPLLVRAKKFSSWKIFLKAIARLKRRACGTKGTGVSTVEERQNAEAWILGQVQSEEFNREILILKQGTELPEGSPLFTFDPILANGMLRVGGRLERSESPYKVRHPIILPKDSHTTKLLISHYHQQTQHSGKNMTLNTLRANGYWVINGAKLISSIIHKCVQCRKKRRPLEEQRMADLPIDRVTATAPFAHTGMDCFGPIMVKEGRKEHKRYGLLFTCKCSRAVHIEVLDDMSTDCFLNALRCFIALRGSVATLHSDQGSNFVGAASELKAALKELDTEKIERYMFDQQCVFEFNPPHASHCGGLWERQIRTVRSILTSMLDATVSRLDTSSLRTLLYEVSSIVNSRPLTTDSLNDPTSLEPLTPNHILTMKSRTVLPPPGNFVKQDVYLRKRWRRVQYLCEQFWSRWRKEYLSNIQLRSKWHKQRPNLKTGDIVILKEEETPRNKWPLARVVEAVSSGDGLVRKVKIVLPAPLDKKGKPISHPTTLERPVQKLVLLLDD